MSMKLIWVIVTIKGDITSGTTTFNSHEQCIETKKQLILDVKAMDNILSLSVIAARDT